AGGRAGDKVVVACEDCVVVRTAGWFSGTHYVLVRTSTLLCTYGGLNKDNLPRAGVELQRGDKIGVMGTAYSGLHIELYRDDGRTRPSSWGIGENPPAGLLSPVNYIQAAMGIPRTRETIVQRHDALRELGFYAGPALAPWTNASEQALQAAQESLEVEADGKWGPKTEAAVTLALGRLANRPPSVDPGPGEKSRGESRKRWYWKAALAAGLGLGVYLWG
ncbi:MAG: peptidoglycan-binding protein, partial [Nannocystaceae bacterium]